MVRLVLAEDGVEDDQDAVGSPRHDESQEDGRQGLGCFAVLKSKVNTPRDTYIYFV